MTLEAVAKSARRLRTHHVFHEVDVERAELRTVGFRVSGLNPMRQLVKDHPRGPHTSRQSHLHTVRVEPTPGRRVHAPPPIPDSDLYDRSEHRAEPSLLGQPVDVGDDVVGRFKSLVFEMIPQDLFGFVHSVSLAISWSTHRHIISNELFSFR